MADLNLTAGLDTSNADKGFKQLQQSLAQLSQQVQSQSNMMTGAFDSLKTKGLEALGALGIATGLKSFATQVATVRGEFQQLESAFTTLIGNEDKAMNLMNQLTHTAAITPFGLQDVASAAKQLLAYGTAADDVNDKIMQLGNIAAGLNLNMGYMSMLYGTTASKDYMDTLDLKQHKAQGIAIDEEIAKVMGIDRKEVTSKITNREVSSAIYKQAIANLAGNGGKFDGMMESQSKTITGQISNIEDAVSMMFNDIGKSTEGIISDVLSGATWVVENYSKIAEAIGAVAGAYGVYKAALVATTAVQSASTKSEIQALQGVLDKQNEVYSDEHLAKMVERGYLTGEEANQLVALRKEVAERQKQYDDEVTYYQDAYDSISKQVDAKQEEVDMWTEEIRQATARKAAAEEAGDMEAVQSATTDLATAATERNTAAEELHNLMTNQSSAAQAVSTAQTKAKTFATEANTVATNANSKAQQFCGLVGKQLTGVFNGIKAALISNPIGAVCAAVTALGYAIYKVVTYQTDWEQAQDAINESMNKGVASASTEIVKLQSLCERVNETKDALDKATQAQNDQTKATDDEETATTSAADAQAEYNRVKMDVISQFGDYHKGLENEYDALVKNNNLYEVLTSNIMEYHMKKAKANAETEAMDAYTESIEEQYSEADEIIEEYKGRALRSANKKVESGQITAIDRQKVEEDWKRAEKEIKQAIMNGTLSYSFEGGLQALKKVGINEDGTDKYIDQLSETTKKLMESRDAVSGVSSNLMADVAKEVAERNEVLKKSREEIEQKYQDAFTDNDIRMPSSSQGAGEVSTDGTVVSGEYNSEWLKKKAEQIKQAEKDYQQAVKDLKAGKRYQPLGTTDVADMKDIDNEYVQGKKAALDKYLKEYQEATGENFYAGTTRIKLTKGGGEKSIDVNATKKERDQLIKAQEESEREAGEAAINAVRQRMLSEEEARINLMDESYQKRLALRALNNKKEILAIYEEADQQKEAVITAAKQRFDAEETIKEKNANLQGRNYEKRTFDRDAFIASQIDEEGRGKRSDFLIIDQQAAQKYEATIAAQTKASNEQYLQDIQNYREHWEKILEINKTYVSSVRDVDKRVKTGEISQSDADTEKRVLSMNYEDEMAQMNADGSLNSPEAQKTETEISALVNAVLAKDMAAMEQLLQEAFTQLDALSDDEKANPETVAVLKAKITALQAQIKSQRAEQGATGGTALIKKTIKAWNSWGDTVANTNAVLKEVGETVGGSFGEVLSGVSDISDATITVIDSISNFAEFSMNTIQTTSEQASAAIQAAEKATVILAIIEAAIKLFNIVDGFLNGDDTKEAWENAVAKQQEVNKMTDAVNNYRTAVMKAKQEEKSWFSATGFDDITSSIETAQNAMENYTNKANQQQVKYQNEKGGRSFLSRLTSVFVATGLGPIGTAVKVAQKQNDEAEAAIAIAKAGMVSAVDNLRFETRAATKGKFFKKGKSQQTVDLRTWAKETYGADLFDEDGMIDTEMAQNIIDNYGDKLVGETKATLETLIEEAEAYQEAMDSLKDTVSEWYSPLVDNMTDALLNWLDTGEDVLTTFEDSAGETFRSIAQQMVKTLVQTTVYDGFSDKVKALAEQYGKGEITMDEMYAKSLQYTDEAMKTAETAMPQLQNYMEQINELGKQYGIDITGDTEEQSATFGGYETMSEETGTELSGRFSAMYIVQSEHLALAQGMSDKMQTSLNVLSVGNGIMNDIRTLHSQSNTLLTSLLKVTSNIYGNWNERIEHIEKYTKNMQ